MFITLENSDNALGNLLNKTPKKKKKPYKRTAHKRAELASKQRCWKLHTELEGKNWTVS
jgi:hypothetical protein